MLEKLKSIIREIVDTYTNTYRQCQPRHSATNYKMDSTTKHEHAQNDKNKHISFEHWLLSKQNAQLCVRAREQLDRCGILQIS